nr:hypothetical protein CFP56_79376 [Quercus suber]
MYTLYPIHVHVRKRHGRQTAMSMCSRLGLSNYVIWCSLYGNNGLTLKSLRDAHINKYTSEAPAGTPAAEGLWRNPTSLPPKPKDAPAGRLYHFGALRGAA